MKTATLLAFLLLGLVCTYAATAEQEITEDEPQVEDEMIKDDEEKIENDEEDEKKRAIKEIENDEIDEEKRAIIRRRPYACLRTSRRLHCRKRILRRLKKIFYCILRCLCTFFCKILKCSRHSFPRCPY